MSRPSSCPNCGASATAHTGGYCHGCGEPLTPPPSSPAGRHQAASRRLDRARAAHRMTPTPTTERALDRATAAYETAATRLLETRCNGRT